MRKIRSKIILVLMVTVLLPVIPLSFLVNNLVNQSYRAGVNPEVNQALKDGLWFSKAIYDLQRKELSDGLSRIQFPNSLTSLKNEEIIQKLMIDTLFWNLQSLACYDQDGNLQWERKLHPAFDEKPDGRLFEEVKNSGRNILVVSNREENRFIAIRRVSELNAPGAFLVLQAGFDKSYLEKADHVLDVLQMYQTLDLSQHSLPESFLYAFVAIALILLVCIVFAGIWLSSRITSPLSMIVEGTAEIGRGNLDYRLPALNRNDELGQLVEHFNKMAQELKQKQERMIYLEKMAAWQQMARKLAHEIKNPLTPIQLTTQQMVDKYAGNDDGYEKLLRECASIIQEEIGSLRRLVNEFSEFGRMPELELHNGNLNDLIKEVGGLYGKRIEIEPDDRLPQFRFDSDRLRRVFINLIENAIQADRDENPVRIRTESTNSRVIISVSDRGKGIPEEEISRIFEPYFSTKEEGTGLGLAITRLIIEEHNGSIKVESGEESGTTFTIELPFTF